MEENKWTREELIDFIINALQELDGVHENTRTMLNEMSWEELDKEADWLWGLMLK